MNTKILIVGKTNSRDIFLNQLRLRNKKNNKVLIIDRKETSVTNTALGVDPVGRPTVDVIWSGIYEWDGKRGCVLSMLRLHDLFAGVYVVEELEIEDDAPEGYIFETLRIDIFDEDLKHRITLELPSKENRATTTATKKEEKQNIEPMIHTRWGEMKRTELIHLLFGCSEEEYRNLRVGIEPIVESLNISNRLDETDFYMMGLLRSGIKTSKAYEKPIAAPTIQPETWKESFIARLDCLRKEYKPMTNIVPEFLEALINSKNIMVRGFTPLDVLIREYSEPNEYYAIILTMVLGYILDDSVLDDEEAVYRATLYSYTPQNDSGYLRISPNIINIINSFFERLESNHEDVTPLIMGTIRPIITEIADEIASFMVLNEIVILFINQLFLQAKNSKGFFSWLKERMSNDVIDIVEVFTTRKPFVDSIYNAANRRKEEQERKQIEVIEEPIEPIIPEDEKDTGIVIDGNGVMHLDTINLYDYGDIDMLSEYVDEVLGEDDLFDENLPEYPHTPFYIFRLLCLIAGLYAYRLPVNIFIYLNQLQASYTKNPDDFGSLVEKEKMNEINKHMKESLKGSYVTAIKFLEIRDDFLLFAQGMLLYFRMSEKDISFMGKYRNRLVELCNNNSTSSIDESYIKELRARIKALEIG